MHTTGQRVIAGQSRAIAQDQAAHGDRLGNTNIFIRNRTGPSQGERFHAFQAAQRKDASINDIGTVISALATQGDDRYRRCGNGTDVARGAGQHIAVGGRGDGAENLNTRQWQRAGRDGFTNPHIGIGHGSRGSCQKAAASFAKQIATARYKRGTRQTDRVRAIKHLGHRTRQGACGRTRVRPQAAIACAQRCRTDGCVDLPEIGSEPGGTERAKCVACCRVGEVSEPAPAGGDEGCGTCCIQHARDGAYFEVATATSAQGGVDQAHIAGCLQLDPCCGIKGTTDAIERIEVNATARAANVDGPRTGCDGAGGRKINVAARQH